MLCTINQQLLNYQDPWAQDPGDRTGEIKAKKMIQSKSRAFIQNSMQSCAQLPNKSSMALTMESVLKRWVSGVWLKVEFSATAGMLMHKNQLGRDNRAREHGPYRSQEQVEILEKLATLIAARTTRGRPGRASVVVQQCMTQFGIYSDFKMTSQKVNRVVNLLEWTTVLEVTIKYRRAHLSFRTTKQERWSKRAQDRQQWRKQLLRMFGPELIQINYWINELIKTAQSAVSKNRFFFCGVSREILKIWWWWLLLLL